MKKKKITGFASMSIEKRKAIASLGGKKAQAMGVSHRWNSEEAKAAGHKGGSVKGYRKRKKSVKD